jgi:hypothetical protein
MYLEDPKGEGQEKALSKQLVVKPRYTTFITSIMISTTRISRRASKISGRAR